MENTTAMILAGGRGKRMDIFCQQRAKPALPFGGNYKVIDFTLSNCVNSCIHSIAVLVDYQRFTMSDYLAKWNLANSKEALLTILPPVNGSYSGTSDAVYQNLEYLKRQNCSRVLILAGDHIYRMDYRKMLEFHKTVKAAVTVGIVRVPRIQADRFGTVTVGSDARILEFVEKSSSPRSDLASMGIYVFENEILAKYLSEDAKNVNSPHDFGYAILPDIVKKERVFSFEYTDYWQDIGTVEAYYEANMELLKKDPHFKPGPDWPVFSVPSQTPASTFSENSRIVNSLISPGCIVKGYVENSILSPGVFVGEEAAILNSVIMDNSTIGMYSIVDRCILDEGVNVGKFCYLGFGADPQPGVWDITLLGKEVSVPSQTAIGRKSRVLPGINMEALETV